MSDWEERGRKENQNIMGKCNTDEWSISISPYYLENIVNGIEGIKRDYDINISLNELGGHEVYHLWESVAFPKTFKKHGEKDKEIITRITTLGESFEIYKPSASEKAAGRFGRVLSQAMAWARVSRLKPDEEVTGFIDNLEHIQIISLD
jgi:hypothetical protein